MYLNIFALNFLKFMKKCYLLCSCLLSMYTSFSSANINESSLILKSTSSYHYGLGAASFQDKATSPLIYTGVQVKLGLGESYFSARHHEVYWNLMLNYGFLFNNPKHTTLTSENISHLILGDAHVGFFRNIPNLSQGNWQVKVGGRIEGFGDFRINTSHFNNALGYDIVFTAAASGKASYNWTLNTKKKQYSNVLFASAHIGVLNLNNRPGYNYLNNFPITSDEHMKDSQIKRSWSFNGFKLNTEIGIQFASNAGYNKQISYVFEGLSAPGKYERMGYASHALKYTINLNKYKK